MSSSTNKTKSNLRTSQSRKRKLKKTNDATDEWAALEWTCVDSPTNTIDEKWA